jgi:hypothetical protein
MSARTTQRERVLRDPYVAGNRDRLAQVRSSPARGIPDSPINALNETVPEESVRDSLTGTEIVPKFKYSSKPINTITDAEKDVVAVKAVVDVFIDRGKTFQDPNTDMNLLPRNDMMKRVIIGDIQGKIRNFEEVSSTYRRETSKEKAAAVLSEYAKLRDIVSNFEPTIFAKGFRVKGGKVIDVIEESLGVISTNLLFTDPASGQFVYEVGLGG